MLFKLVVLLAFIVYLDSIAFQLCSHFAPLIRCLAFGTYHATDLLAFVHFFLFPYSFYLEFSVSVDILPSFFSRTEQIPNFLIHKIKTQILWFF